MKERKIRKYIIIILLMLVILVSGTTYALFTKTVNTRGVITIKSGKRYIGIYGEDKENLGLNVTYTFTIENRGIEEASEPSIKTPGAFQIKFVDKNATEMGSGQYTGANPKEYFIPSSFCWGDSCDIESTRKDTGNIELSGIWISKFEITGTLNSISSLPNQKSIVNTNISSYFNNIKSNMNNNNVLINYGLSGNYDMHMIKHKVNMVSMEIEIMN